MIPVKFSNNTFKKSLPSNNILKIMVSLCNSAQNRTLDAALETNASVRSFCYQEP